MRCCLALLAALVTVPVLATPALAEPPTRGEGEFAYVQVHEPGPDACEFPVREAAGARVVGKVFTGKDGTVVKEIVTFPRAYQEWTNLDTGEQLRLAWSGPTFTRHTDDGTLLVGTGIYSWPRDPRLPLGASEAGMWVTMGRHVLDETTGEFRIVGRVIDVCEALAP